MKTISTNQIQHSIFFSPIFVSCSSFSVLSISMMMNSHVKPNWNRWKLKERKIQRQTRSGNSSPLHYITPVFNTRSTLPSSTAKTASSNYPNQNSVAAATGSGGGGSAGVGASANMGSPYYRDMDEPTSPAGGGHHRSRSASRPPISHTMDYPSMFCSPQTNPRVLSISN